jgi:hypothetical protein
VVADPDNTVSPADPSKVDDLPLPGLTPTGPTFTSDGGVDYGDTITGGYLPVATTVELAWASGKAQSDIKGSPIDTQPTSTGPGTDGPFHVPATALQDPPAGAQYLLAVTDPGNLVPLADANNVSALALTDVAVAAPMFNADDGVDVPYTISGANLPQAATIDLYYASGTTPESEIGGAIAIGSTMTAQGSYTLTVPRSDLGDAPEGAKFILAVADPDGMLVESDKGNNVAALALPDIDAQSLDWHKTSVPVTSQDANAVGSHSTGGGVDFKYQVVAGMAPTDITVGFYWGDGSMPLESLDQPLYSLTIPAGTAAMQSDTNQVTASDLMGPDGMMVPPQGTTTLLAIIDPLDSVVMTDTTSDSIQLGITAADIFDNSDPDHPSLSEAAQGSHIYAHFTPVGGALNLQQAAAILGVNHFNWQQTFTGPGTWQVLEEVGAETGPEQSPYTGQVDANGNAIYNLADDPDDTSPPAFADGTLMDLQNAPTPYYDPIVKVTGREMYVIKVLRFTIQDTVRYITIPQNWDNTLPTYLTEGANPEWASSPSDSNSAGGTTADGLDFVFIDQPALPDYALSGQNGVARSGFYIKFQTSLVGVNGSQVMPLEDPATQFKWKSNSVFTETNSNIVSGQAIVVTKPLPDFVPTISSGGVFDVQSDTTTSSDTSTTVSFSNNPVPSGQTVTLTAVVGSTTGAALPTGDVDFVDGTTGSDLGTVRLMDGAAQLSLSSLPVGDHSIIAFYSGDTDSQGSSTQATLTVNSAAMSSVRLSNVSGMGTYGGTASLTATLTAGGAPLAGKTVTFSLNEGGTVTPVGTATTNTNGIASLSGISLAGFGAGTLTGAVVDSFAGDATDTSSNNSGDLSVSPAQATLSLSGLVFTYDGSPHTATVSTNPAGLGGVTVSYALNNVPVAAPTQAGSYTVTAALNNPNYTGMSVAGTLVIHQATPTITWTSPADITSGTPLESAQLDATGSVPGTFSYNPAAGTVLNPGQGQTLTVMFTPTDTTDYATASGSTLINVLSAPLPPTPPQATGVVGVGHSKKGLTSITIGFNEALDQSSVVNPSLYSVLGAVTKRKKTVYSKAVGIQSISLNGNSKVTINLAKPFKGAVQVTVQAGIAATNGTKSSGRFIAVTR